MPDFSLFFSRIDDFICPELFSPKLDGYADLENIWDVLLRIQQGFVKNTVKPQILGTIEDGAIVKGDIYLGEGSIIEAGACVCGPAIIGKNVTVRHGALIRGDVICGDGAVVGHTTEVVRSVFLPEAKAPHFNYVGDSILGSKVNLGAGSKLSNLKHDRTLVKAVINGQYIQTNLKKFGVILGDGCQIGCNAVTNPGTIMEPGCMVYACASIHGYFSKNTIVKLKQQQTRIVKNTN